MIGQNPKAEVAPFSSAEIGIRKSVLGQQLGVTRCVDTVAKTPGEEAKKRIMDKKRSDAFKPNCKKIPLAHKRENTLRRNPSKT